MATVTAPIMTDATGQSIDSKLNSLLGKMDNLAAAFQPNASGINYSNTTSGLTGDDVQEAIDEMAADVSEIKQSLSNYTNYIFDEVLIGKRQGYNLYRRRMDFSNIQCATGTEVSLGTNVLPSGALNPTISDKSFIKMGNTEQIFSPNNMYFITYFIGRNAYFRQGFSSSQTWSLVLFVEYTLPA